MITPERILAEVCREYGVSAESLIEHKRTAQLSEARQMSQYLMKVTLLMTCQDIGEFTKRCHTSVVYANKRIKGLIEVDRATAKHYTNIINRLNENV